MKPKESRTSIATARRTSAPVIVLMAIVPMAEIVADAAAVRAAAGVIADAAGVADVPVAADVIVDAAGRAGDDTRNFDTDFRG